MVVRLDLSKHLAPIHLGHVQIKQDNVRAAHASIFALSAQKRHRLNAVLDRVNFVVHPTLLEGFHGQAHITRVILNQQNLDTLWNIGSTHD